MNKILKSLLSVAVISASFASCSQVDTLTESELAEQKKTTSVAINKHPEWTYGRTIVCATNVSGHYDKIFYHNNGDVKVLSGIPVGAYKFYAVYENSTFDYENLDRNKLAKDSLYVYYANLSIASKAEKLEEHPDLKSITDEGVKKVFTGSYVRRNAGDVFADSTALVEVKLGQETSVTFEKPFSLTTLYDVSGTLKSEKKMEKVYVEICDIVAKRGPNGSVGSKNAKEVLVYNIYGAAQEATKELTNTMRLLGISNNGNANVYVRFKGDDKSKAPEMKSVRYTVKEETGDDGKIHTFIKLGDITF